MAAKSVYTCRDCGGSSPKWLGKCPHCGAWNTLDEGPAEAPGGGAKNRFQALYRSEEKRIFDSSQQLLDIERELSRRPEVADAELAEEFRRFRQFKEEFDRKRSEGEIRHSQVTRLAESIDQLMSRLDVTSGAPAEEAPISLDALESEELDEARETISGYFPGRDAVAPVPVAAAEPERPTVPVATDPLGTGTGTITPPGNAPAVPGRAGVAEPSVRSAAGWPMVTSAADLATDASPADEPAAETAERPRALPPAPGGLPEAQPIPPGGHPAPDLTLSADLPPALAPAQARP